MKIPSSTLKSLAISAGIGASLATSGSAASSVPEVRKPIDPKGNVKLPGAEKEAADAPKIAICREAPAPPKRPVRLIDKNPIVKTSKQIFTEADKNKDGKLSKEEFTKAFQAIVAQEKSRQDRKHRVRIQRPNNQVRPHLPMGKGNDCPGCGLG